MSVECTNAPPCPRDDETKRILGELTILIDMIRLYLSKMIEGAPVLN